VCGASCPACHLWCRCGDNSGGMEAWLRPVEDPWLKPCLYSLVTKWFAPGAGQRGLAWRDITSELTEDSTLAERFASTPLGTRTTESNMCASRWVANPRGASNLTEQNRPTMIFCERFECAEIGLSGDRAKRQAKQLVIRAVRCSLNSP